MLATSVRVRPWRDRCWRSSDGRVTTIDPSSWATVMSSGASHWSSPRGPLTRMWLPEMDTSTPDGTGMGFWPILLIAARSAPSPHVAEDLAADLALARLAVGQQALVGREDRDAEAAQHARDGVGLRVD